MTGAVFFDVDGTLVPGTSSSQFLGGHLGHQAALAAAEEEYRCGSIGNDTVSALDASGWAGRSEGEIADWLQDLPLVDGIAEVVERCRQLALAPYLATLAWAPVGAHLCASFGFEGACGPTLVTVRGRFTGEVAEHLDEFGKRDFALGVARDLGLSPTGCAAVGDSRSDVPLFDEVGLSIGFNPDDAVSEQADVLVWGHDLRAILPHLETWARAEGRRQDP